MYWFTYCEKISSCCNSTFLLLSNFKFLRLYFSLHCVYIFILLTPSHIFFPSIAVFFLNGLLIIFHLGFIPFSLFFKSGYELIKDRLGAVEISIVEHLSNDNDDIWKDGTNKMTSWTYLITPNLNLEQKRFCGWKSESESLMACRTNYSLLKPSLLEILTKMLKPALSPG